MNTSPHQGKLKVWHRDRGFGFIQPDAGGKDVFLHISAVRKAAREPQIGDTILYIPVLQNDGRLRATNATIQGVVLQPQSTSEQKPTRRITRPVRQPVNSPKAKSRSAFETGLVAVGAIVFGYLALLPLIKSSFSESRSTTSDTGSATPSRGSTITSTLDPTCVIKGNISWNAGRKYYHLPGMEDYGNTQIDLEKGERWFCSEAEARAAGWVRAPTP